MLDFMLGRLNEFARIVMCGAISDYSELFALDCTTVIRYSSIFYHDAAR